MLVGVRLFILYGAVLLTSEGRSIGETAGVNFPNQGAYQEYAEEQEYAEQQGEAERQARNTQDNGVESYQQEKQYARDVRDSGADEVNTNVVEVAYQPRANEDDDLEQQPPNNEVQVGMDSRGMRKEEESVDGDLSESDALRQNSNIEQAEVVGAENIGGPNFRPPRENGLNQAVNEAARTEMISEDAKLVGYEGERQEGGPQEAAGRSNHDATYNGIEEEHYNNYNYVQEQDGAADGQEPQQQGVAANEESVGAP